MYRDKRDYMVAHSLLQITHEMASSQVSSIASSWEYTVTSPSFSYLSHTHTHTHNITWALPLIFIFSRTLKISLFFSFYS